MYIRLFVKFMIGPTMAAIVVVFAGCAGEGEPGGPGGPGPGPEASRHRSATRRRSSKSWSSSPRGRTHSHPRDRQGTGDRPAPLGDDRSADQGMCQAGSRHGQERTTQGIPRIVDRAERGIRPVGQGSRARPPRPRIAMPPFRGTRPARGLLHELPSRTSQDGPRRGRRPGRTGGADQVDPAGGRGFPKGAPPPPPGG